MDLSLFDYHLPPELIAQRPAPERDQSRLLIVQRETQTLRENHFCDIASQFRQGDVLVINDTKVFPARLHGRKTPGGAAIEMLLLHPAADRTWEVIAYRASRLSVGTQVEFSADLVCSIVEVLGDGKFRAAFEWSGEWEKALALAGEVPLPPYIERADGELSAEDHERYQTVYARANREQGSPAAPTAGLHFTPELLLQIREQGVHIAPLTLRVGLDTFLPMRVECVEEHIMHAESYWVPAETAEIVNRAKMEGRRVIAVGTTSLRTLESAAEGARIQAGMGESRLFIYPGYTFKIVDGLITNFHLPKSTLLLLVSAFMGGDLRERAYAYAVQNRFRFYSYGDAMLIV